MGSTILNLYLENWWGSEWETGKLAAFPVWKLEDREDPGHFRHLKLRGACSTKVNAVLFPLPEASEQICPTFGMYVRPVTGFWSTGTHLRRKEVWDYTVSAIRLLPVLCGALHCFTGGFTTLMSVCSTFAQERARAATDMDKKIWGR